MSQLFALDAQKAGFERHARAETDGLGLTVYLDGEPHRASGLNAAIRIARDYMENSCSRPSAAAFRGG